MNQTTITKLETELAEAEGALAASSEKLAAAREQHKRTRAPKQWQAVEAAMLDERRLLNERDGIREDLDGARKEHAAREHAQAVEVCKARAADTSLESFLGFVQQKIDRAAALKKEQAEIVAELDTLSTTFSAERRAVSLLAAELGSESVCLIAYAKIVAVRIALASGADTKQAVSEAFALDLPAGLSAERMLHAVAVGVDPTHAVALVRALRDGVARHDATAAKFLAEGPGRDIDQNAPARQFKEVTRELNQTRRRLAELGFADLADTVRSDRLATKLASAADYTQVVNLVNEMRFQDHERHLHPHLYDAAKVADCRRKLEAMGVAEFGFPRARSNEGASSSAALTH